MFDATAPTLSTVGVAHAYLSTPFAISLNLSVFPSLCALLLVFHQGKCWQSCSWRCLWRPYSSSLPPRVDSLPPKSRFSFSLYSLQGSFSTLRQSSTLSFPSSTFAPVRCCFQKVVSWRVPRPAYLPVFFDIHVFIDHSMAASPTRLDFPLGLVLDDLAGCPFFVNGLGEQYVLLFRPLLFFVMLCVLYGLHKLLVLLLPLCCRCLLCRRGSTQFRFQENAVWVSLCFPVTTMYSVLFR